MHKTNENSEIDSLFIVSKLITTYYVVTLPKLYIYINIRPGIPYSLINIHLQSTEERCGNYSVIYIIASRFCDLRSRLLIQFFSFEYRVIYVGCGVYTPVALMLSFYIIILYVFQKKV